MGIRENDASENPIKILSLTIIITASLLTFRVAKKLKERKALDGTVGTSILKDSRNLYFFLDFLEK